MVTVGIFGRVLAAAALAFACTSATAQQWPTRPVKLIVAYPPGGSSDLMARIVAAKFADLWGQQVLVENKPGAAGAIGTDYAAKQPPDGYSFMIANLGPIAVNPLLSSVPYNVDKDFVAVSQISQGPNVLVVRADAPFRSLKDIIDYGKANPGKLSYASQGVGSTAHLSAAQLEAQAGIKMVHVPYRGAQPALTDVVAGHVDMFFDTLATSVPLYRENKVKLLGVADLQRAAVIPDVPTFSEAGLPGFKSITWFGLVAPPATPAALTDKINRDVVEILKSKEVGEMLRRISLEAGATTPSDTARFFADETALWSKVIKEAGIQPQ